MIFNKSIQIGIRKLKENAQTPSYGTEESACFDISSFFLPNDPVVGFAEDNEQYKMSIVDDQIILPAGHRALIPTGLVFIIPQGYSIRLHPRSGLALKNGIGLVNSEGIIDSDYYFETFIPIINTSHEDFVIKNNMRLCQGEVIKTLKTEFKLMDLVPENKDRTGGFGSTGE